MNRFACAAGIGLLVSGHAGPAEKAIIAAMQLAASPNYSWTCTVDDDTGTYRVHGKTDGTGFTWVRMPIAGDVARQLGRDGDSEMEVFFHANRASVLRTPGGWQTVAELPRSREQVDTTLATVPVHGRLAGRPFGILGLHPGSMAPLAGREKAEPPRYDSRHYGVIHPHEDLAIIVSTCAALTIQEDTASGTLSDTGAALLLVRNEQQRLTPLAAGGTFKLWLRDGYVARYQLRIEGVLLDEKRNRLEAHLRADTRVTDVGATHLSVPDEARLKLAR